MAGDAKELLLKIASVLGAERDGCNTTEVETKYRAFYGNPLEIPSEYPSLEAFFVSEIGTMYVEKKNQRWFAVERKEIAHVIKLVNSTHTKKKKRKQLFGVPYHDHRGYGYWQRKPFYLRKSPWVRNHCEPQKVVKANIAASEVRNKNQGSRFSVDDELSLNLFRTALKENEGRCVPQGPSLEEEEEFNARRNKCIANESTSYYVNHSALAKRSASLKVNDLAVSGPFFPKIRILIFLGGQKVYQLTGKSRGRRDVE
ncbi:unnamed protein product [Enterobius vermicularis]|uniref:Tudor domain-containing protein n=1 Tax=Enterobius vermicularis TaxID=51028 RepID=A0A0N4VH27_ENTVE|nr:unnamed protein product [Enterobius vermicularis]